MLTVCFSATAAYGQDKSSTEVQAANDIVNLFSEVCLHNLDHLNEVRDWAASKKLPKITNAEGRKIFVGEGDDGTGWFLLGKSTTIVLSIRSKTGACAVFGEHADSVAFANWYDTILKNLAAPIGSKAINTPEPDKVTAGQFGLRTGKVRTIFKDGRLFLFILITNEKSGGAYQASMQIGVITGKN